MKTTAETEQAIELTRKSRHIVGCLRYNWRRCPLSLLRQRLRSTCPYQKSMRQLHGRIHIPQAAYITYSSLNRLREALDGEGMAPSRLISRLDQLIALLDSMRIQFFAPFAFLLLWEIQLA